MHRGMQERRCSVKEEKEEKEEVQQKGLQSRTREERSSLWLWLWRRRETKGNSCGQFFPEFRRTLRAPPPRAILARGHGTVQIRYMVI